MQSLHVIFTKENIDETRLASENKVVVVLDVLFATTTIVQALHAGARSVWPAIDSVNARSIGNGCPNSVLAGEYMMNPLPGFADASPLKLSSQNLTGKDVVYCTTNGTVALLRSVGAEYVYAGALLNAAALAQHIMREHADSSVLFVCAGSRGSFCIEDSFAAGFFVELFRKLASYRLTDAARAAAMLAQNGSAKDVLQHSATGLALMERGYAGDVLYAANINIVQTVPFFDGKKIVDLRINVESEDPPNSSLRLRDRTQSVA